MPWVYDFMLQYCAKVLGPQSNCHLLVKFTILQDKLGRKSCSSLALGAATTRSNYCGTILSHWPNKLVCYIWINSLTWCKKAFLILQDVRMVFYLTSSLLIPKDIQSGLGRYSFIAMDWLIFLSIGLFSLWHGALSCLKIKSPPQSSLPSFRRSQDRK